MLTTKEILEKYSLIIEKEIKTTEFKKVLLLKDNKNNKYILKIYLVNIYREGREIEKKFLLTVKDKQFKSLIFPNIIDYGDNYLLMDYLHIYEYDKDAIINSKWSNDDIKLLISGLIEFQNIQVPSKFFSFKKRVFGFLFPPFKIITLLSDTKLFNLTSLLILVKLIIFYILSIPFFKYTLTHHDLQRTNFTFHKMAKKIPMLDFESLYYLGDPFLDILHYLTTASYKLEDWTFQLKILREYIRAINQSGSYITLLSNKIRMILLIYNYNYYFSVRNIKLKNIFLKNVFFLLSNKNFNKWIYPILA